MKIYTGAVFPRNTQQVNRAPYRINGYVTVTESFGPGTVVNFSSDVPGGMTVTNGYVTPEFKKLRSDGWLVNNPFSRSTNWVVVQPSFYTEKWTEKTGRKGWATNTYHNQCWMDVDLYPSVELPDLGIQSARDQVATAVFAKASQAEATLLVDLAEFKSTLSMFGALATDFLRLLRSRRFTDIGDLLLNHGKSDKLRVYGSDRAKSVGGLVKSLSGIYLEARYGWGPLIYSIQDVSKALADGVADNKRITYRSHQSVMNEKVSSSTAYVSYAGANMPRVFTSKLEYRNDVRAGVMFEQGVTLQKALGLNPWLIPHAAWDLIPLSFVVDWFFNIGQWLQSLAAPANLVNGYVSWRTETESIIRTYSVDLPAGTFRNDSTHKVERLSAGRFEMVMTSYTKRRVPMRYSYAAPTLKHNWLEFTNILHVLDSIALVVQRLR